MSDSCDDLSSSSTQITNKKWISHFENLHKKHNLAPKQEDILKNLEFLENNIDDNNTLDDPITEDDIISAATKLKHKKSAYSDRIRNEMIKSSAKILLKGYDILFNLILECRILPDKWCEGLLTPIFKSGDKQDPNNYRGICVTSCMGKFFCLILNKRLNDFTQEKFQSGHRTADHVFTLKTLIDKHVTQNKNNEIYTCFVDFKKAFDSVWHEGLYSKLLKYTIGGNFYRLIKLN